VQWSESLTGKFSGEQVTQNIGYAYQMNVYVSTAGRPFVRLVQTGKGDRQVRSMVAGFLSTVSDEAAPGQASAKDHVNFEGRSLAVYREFQSGARRIAIDLDGTGCKATIINGRRPGDKLLRPQMGSGRAFEASSVQIGTVSCSVKEGNVFGH
jgi:hypothetical protein